ncbi:hypothetical protein D3C81_2020980 [compost metagenome]
MSTGTARIFSSPPASSTIFSTPMGRERMTQPGTTGVGFSTMTSQGSPSSDRVCGTKP